MHDNRRISNSSHLSIKRILAGILAGISWVGERLHLTDGQTETNVSILSEAESKNLVSML